MDTEIDTCNRCFLHKEVAFSYTSHTKTFGVVHYNLCNSCVKEMLQRMISSSSDNANKFITFMKDYAQPRQT